MIIKVLTLDLIIGQSCTNGLFKKFKENEEEGKRREPRGKRKRPSLRGGGGV